MNFSKSSGMLYTDMLHIVNSKQQEKSSDCRIQFNGLQPTRCLILGPKTESYFRYICPKNREWNVSKKNKGHINLKY